MSGRGSILRWAAMALAGLVVAAAVALAASHLVSQRIGLDSQPLNAGRELAPASVRPAPAQHNAHHGDRTRRSGTVPLPQSGPPPVTTPVAPAPAPSGSAAPPTSPTPSGDGESSGPDD